jgi:hypothetical protein
MRPLRLAALLIALALPAAAQEAPIQGTIRAQIDAFLKDDFATAFTFASPGIQAMFGSADRFGQMVVTGYPMVHRPADVRMLDLTERDGQLWQRVLITDAEGRIHILGYEMVETPEGWRIDGVVILQADDATA